MVAGEPSELFVDVRDASGSFRVEYLGAGIGRSIFSGHFNRAFAEHLIEQAGRLHARYGPLHLFHDWWGLERHDAAARSRLTRWALETRGQRSSVHILVNVSSPVLAMAVTVTNLVLHGVVQVHESRSTFDRELAARRNPRRVTPPPLRRL